VTREAIARYLAALNDHDPAAVAASVTNDFDNEHTSRLGESTHGRAAYVERLRAFLAEFADLSYTVEEVVVEADRAAVAYTMTCNWQGTHAVTIRGMFRLRVAGGLVAHRVDYWDSADFIRQTGTGPGPVSAEARAADAATQPMPGPTAR